MNDGPLYGAWSVRHSVAKKMYDCIECGHLIMPGETYWRRYGKMAEAFKPWTARMCDHCETTWLKRDTFAKKEDRNMRATN